MNRDQKRFTISVTPELAAELTAVKQSSYPGVPPGRDVPGPNHPGPCGVGEAVRQE